MTRYVMLRDHIFDLSDGSMETDRPIDRRCGHSIWSAEALLEELTRMTAPTVIRPFYFLDVIE